MAEAREQPFLRRLGFFAAFIVAGFLLVLLRFYYLQVIRGQHYRELSEGNRLALIKTPAPRGFLYDRKHRVLAANRPSFSVGLVPEDVKDVPATAELLSANLGLEKEGLVASLSKVGRYRRFEPLRVKDDVTRDQLSYLETMRYQYPGISLQVETRREYPFGHLAAHLIGYMGEVGPGDLENGRGVGFGIGDTVGKTGLERQYNDVLRGLDGGQEVEVDSSGRRLRVLNDQEPLPGYNLVLTIDRLAQQAAEEALGDRAGTVVALDPRSGEVLAMVSHPDFDPNQFAAGIGTEAWRLLADDPRHPMQNRALQSQYPPGSVFKLVTTIAALQEKLIDESTSFFCAGSIKFGDRNYRCWKKGGHGTVSLHRALVESCDVYYYRVAERMGIDVLARWARRLGLGKQTGLGFGQEAPGLVPDSAWKRKRFGEKWYAGETLNSVIGQGYNLMTPLQMAVMVSAVANGGDVWRPSIVRAIEAPDGTVVREFSSRKVGNAGVRPEILATIQRGMWGVVNEAGGTGSLARLETKPVAGKTGTAQVVRMRQEGEVARTTFTEQQRDHAWFAGYAPYGAPSVVVVVMVEHGGHGGSIGAPIARAVLKALLEPSPDDQPVVVEIPPMSPDEEGD